MPNMILLSLLITVKNTWLHALQLEKFNKEKLKKNGSI